MTPDTTAREWYYSGRAGTVQGPCSAEELTGVFENISLNEVLTADSVYVFHHGCQHGKRLGAVEQRHSAQGAAPGRSREPPISPSGWRRFRRSHAQFRWEHSSASTVSARDREVGQQHPCTEENDRAAFHMIIDGIDDSEDSIGESLLIRQGHRVRSHHASG
jgi:hypothetical protein